MYTCGPNARHGIVKSKKVQSVRSIRCIYIYPYVTNPGRQLLHSAQKRLFVILPTGCQLARLAIFHNTNIDERRNDHPGHIESKIAHQPDAQQHPSASSGLYQQILQSYALFTNPLHSSLRRKRIFAALSNRRRHFCVKTPKFAPEK